LAVEIGGLGKAGGEVRLRRRRLLERGRGVWFREDAKEWEEKEEEEEEVVVMWDWRRERTEERRESKLERSWESGSRRTGRDARSSGSEEASRRRRRAS
jgi:hypothetical protein